MGIDVVRATGSPVVISNDREPGTDCASVVVDRRVAVSGSRTLAMGAMLVKETSLAMGSWRAGGDEGGGSVTMPKSRPLELSPPIADSPRGATAGCDVEEVATDGAASIEDTGMGRMPAALNADVAVLSKLAASGKDRPSPGAPAAVLELDWVVVVTDPPPRIWLRPPPSPFAAAELDELTGDVVVVLPAALLLPIIPPRPPPSPPCAAELETPEVVADERDDMVKVVVVVVPPPPRIGPSPPPSPPCAAALEDELSGSDEETGELETVGGVVVVVVTPPPPSIGPSPPPSPFCEALEEEETIVDVKETDELVQVVDVVVCSTLASLR